MTFEGQQMQGSAKIMEKIASLTFQKIAHVITAVDCQPTFDGGILINVLGQLKVIIRISRKLKKNKTENHFSPLLHARRSQGSKCCPARLFCNVGQDSKTEEILANCWKNGEIGQNCSILRKFASTTTATTTKTKS
jgi:hypothetical protein